MDMVPDNSIHDLQATAAGNGKSPTTYPESPPTSSDSMVDQCIVCLEDLCVASDCIEHQEIVVAATSATEPENTEKQLPIAVIKPCGHSLHDECLREWTQKANSCPFCRQSFNLVEVLDKFGGKSSYLFCLKNLAIASVSGVMPGVVPIFWSYASLPKAILKEVHTGASPPPPRYSTHVYPDHNADLLNRNRLV